MPRTVIFEKSKERKEIRAIGYVRVSTVEQAQEGISLDVQKKTIKSFCKDKGYILLKDRMYRDEGKSAYRGQKRAGLKDVMEDVKNGRCDVVVVYSLSRFSRNTLELLENLRTMREHDVHFISVTEAFIDTTSPIGEALLQIIGTIAQLESAQTGQRVKHVLREKAKNGEYIGAPPPLGYRHVKNGGGKVIHPYYEKLPEGDPERIMVEEVFRLYQRNVGMNHIAEKTGKNRSTVCNILSNPTYTGLMVYLPGSNAFIHDAPYDGYISISTFNANQKRRARRNTINTKAKNHRYTIHKSKGKYNCRPIEV